MYGSNRTITFLALFAVAIACAKPENPVLTQSGLPNSQHPAEIIQLPVVRTTLSAKPAFYQYSGQSGNLASPFDPNHRPRSRSQIAGLTQESAGVLIYTKDVSKNPQTKYVLIGREKQNGYWNFMRGSVDMGDSYVQTAANKLNQETAGVYQITENVLLNESFDVSYSLQARKYGCTFFVELPYVPAEIILQTALTHKNHHFREMDDYAWISLNDLENALLNNSRIFPAQMITGTIRTFDFYPYSFELLKQSQQKTILSNLN